MIENKKLRSPLQENEAFFILEPHHQYSESMPWIQN